VELRESLGEAGTVLYVEEGCFDTCELSFIEGGDCFGIPVAGLWYEHGSGIVYRPRNLSFAAVIIKLANRIAKGPAVTLSFQNFLRRRCRERAV